MTDEPDKVDLETPDLAADYRAALAALFPGVLADGVLDATKLGELLDTPVAQVPDGREGYGIQWAGKAEAVRSLLTPSRGTLVPDMEHSVDFDNAENLFIEGDNLEILKILQKGYNDQIKLIYIDPPYNTGNDFVYKDDFSDGLRGYLEYTGQLDDAGNRLSTDVDAGGRRHSRWLSMMYPRLVLAGIFWRKTAASSCRSTTTRFRICAPFWTKSSVPRTSLRRLFGRSVTRVRIAARSATPTSTCWCTRETSPCSRVQADG